MYPNQSLAEIAKPVVSIAAQSCTTGATATGAQIFAGYAHKISFLFETGAGAGTARFTLEQLNGTTSKAIPFPPKIFVDSITTSAGQFTVTASASDRVDLAASTRVIVDVECSAIDFANGYKNVRAKMVEQGAGTIIVAAKAFVFMRYSGAGNEPSLVAQ